jgi:hypothetical protein
MFRIAGLGCGRNVVLRAAFITAPFGAAVTSNTDTRVLSAKELS